MGEAIAYPSRPRGRHTTSDSKAEQPPLVRRADIVTFALVALLVISVATVLYAAKAFLLPVVTAFVVGTMLSPAAVCSNGIEFLARCRPF